MLTLMPRKKKKDLNNLYLNNNTLFGKTLKLIAIIIN